MSKSLSDAEVREIVKLTQEGLLLIRKRVKEIEAITTVLGAVLRGVAETSEMPPPNPPEMRGSGLKGEGNA